MANFNTCQTVNTAALVNFPFHVYVGASTGFLKACRLDKHKSYNMNSVDVVKAKELEITSMNWWNGDECFLLTARRDCCVFSFNPESGNTERVPIRVSEGSSSITSLRSDEKLIATAFSNGKITCNDFNLRSDSFSLADQEPTLPIVEICSGTDLSCMDYSESRFIAAGGRENALKIWDITSPKQPVFCAKNVKNDWLNLRVPVWVTKAEFLPDNKKIVTSTGYSEIRLYDRSTSQRRPTLEVVLTDKSKRYPITALALSPNSDKQLVVGTAVGTLALVDLRKRSIVKFYRTGTGGGVTDIKFHQKDPVFASCGMDSYLHCFNFHSSQRTHSMFLHSPLNCLLFSSETSQEDHCAKAQEKQQQSMQESSKRNMNSDNDANSDIDDDNMWKDMEIVQTKKRKSKSVLSVTGSKKIKSKVWTS